MALTKQQKVDLVDDLTAMLEGAGTVYLTDYAGLSVEQSTDLRTRFR